VSKDGVSVNPSTWTLHTGPIGVFNNAANYDLSFKKLDEADKAGIRFASTGGWLGFGDKYWLTALVPDSKSPIEAGFLSTAPQVYQAVQTGKPLVIAPGQKRPSASASSRAPRK